MRTQWCRDHRDQAAEMCGLGEDVVADVKRANEFCDEYPDMSVCSTRAVMALKRVKDDQVRDLAISLAIKALNITTPTGGKTHVRLTEQEIKKLIQKAEKQVGGESTEKGGRKIKEKLVNDNHQQISLPNDEPVPDSQLEFQEEVKPELTISQQSSGTESDHARHARISKFQPYKSELNWKPRHIARGELISELTEQYLTEMQLTALKALIDSGEVEDELDAILWIVDRYQELQPSAA
jgi:hypothetical protein